MTNHLVAVAFLILLVAAPIIWLVIGISRSRLTPFQSFLWGVAYLLTRFLWRGRWTGRLNLPEGQGAVIVINHRSSVDPFFIQATTGRKCHWMVAKEYCEQPAFAWFLRACEVIPVNRGGIDTAATKLAIRLVSQGGIVGMFPEGRINMTERLMLPGRPGAALIALKARALLIPCYVEGSPYNRVPWSPFVMPARVTAHFGEPIDLTEFYGREQEPGVVQEVMRRALQAIATLAGQPDFPIEIAGRSWKPTQEQLDADMDAQTERRRKQEE